MLAGFVEVLFFKTSVFYFVYEVQHLGTWGKFFGSIFGGFLIPNAGIQANIATIYVSLQTNAIRNRGFVLYGLV